MGAAPLGTTPEKDVLGDMRPRKAHARCAPFPRSLGQRERVPLQWRRPAQARYDLEASVPVRDAGNIPYVTSLLLPAPDERYIHAQDSDREECHRPEGRRRRVMQTVPVSWTMDDLVHAPHPVRLPVRPDTLGGSLQRCQRCDIPLGSHPCPNPQCREPHGQSVGDLCAWCHHRYEEPRDVLDVVRLPDRTFAVVSRASACVGGVAGPLGGVLGADSIREPCHGRRV